MSWACEDGKPSRYCGEEARKTLGEWIINSANFSTSSDKTVRSLSCAAAAEGGKEAFELLYEKYQAVAEPDDLNGELKAAYNILKSIACTREPQIVQELLNRTLNPNSTANRDAHFIWEKLLENPIGRKEILPFLRSNLDRVLTMFDHRNDEEMRIGALNLISKVLMDVSTVSGFEEQLVEIETFARDNESLLGKLTADFILAGISRQNVEWMGTEGKQVLEWLTYQN
ncbi:unnamed protein product [Orchesella dallaii]|uniref:ERAP1-like C-terminal domain-containing protein n=1 Tax=Orchesella dallaii TaxID=48710 RepID=A0ABP1RGJ9_9HEXA